MLMTAAQSAATKSRSNDQVPDSEIEGQSPLHHAGFCSLLQNKGPQSGWALTPL